MSFERETINVLSILRSKYTDFLINSYYSLFKSNANNRFNFIIFAELREDDEDPYGLSKKCREKLKEFVNDLGHSIEFVDIDCKQFINFRHAHVGGYPDLMYAKLVPHVFLQKDYSRLIYLESDQLFEGDIYEAYRQDFDGNLYMACRVHKSLINFYKNKGKEQGLSTRYINAGMIIYNLELLRKENITIETYEKYNSISKEYYYDEGLFNAVMNDRIKIIPAIYNYEVNQDKEIRYECEVNNVTFRPTIRHYYGSRSKGKPWKHYCYFYLGIETSNVLKKEELNHYQRWWDVSIDSPTFYSILDNQKMESWQDYAKQLMQTNNEKDLNKAIDILSPLINKSVTIKCQYVEALILKGTNYHLDLALDVANTIDDESNKWYLIGKIYKKSSLEKTILFYQKSAELNNEKAQNELIDCLIQCRGSDELEKSIDLCNKYIKENKWWAFAKLARLYRDGLYYEVDLEKSIELYSIAADHNVVWAQKELLLLLQKINDKKYYAKAYNLANELAKKNIGDSKGILARMYRYGKGTEKNLDKAISLFSDAYRQNKTQEWIVSEFVEALIERHTDEDVRALNKMVDEGIEKNKGWAYGRRAEQYHKGIGVIKNDQKAIEYYKEAIDRNVHWAKREFSRYYPDER